MYLKFKRFSDFVLALTLTFITSPIFIFVAIILHYYEKQDVFFRQKRIGINKSVFFILKFSTMVTNAENMKGGTITLKMDPRVTPFGRFLRKTKLNELPQILNILKGEMSFIGPRPMLEKGFSHYLPNVQEKISIVRPGLTGIGSIVFRDEETLISNEKIDNPAAFYENVIFPYKGKLESWYLDNISLILDVKLFLITMWVVIFPKSKGHLESFNSLPPIPEILTEE